MGIEIQHYVKDFNQIKSDLHHIAHIDLLHHIAHINLLSCEGRHGLANSSQVWHICGMLIHSVCNACHINFYRYRYILVGTEIQGKDKIQLK